jgi:DNA mismatch endonuclease, patch repair protein
MSDVFTPKKRSAVMACIRSSGNKDTELKLIGIFKTKHIIGWRRRWPLPGRPDFVFPKLRLAVFVDGCFWHGCSEHFRMPSSNQDYWFSKLARNRARDLKVFQVLQEKGWRVVRLWEHDLKDADKCISRLFEFHV